MFIVMDKNVVLCLYILGFNNVWLKVKNMGLCPFINTPLWLLLIYFQKVFLSLDTFSFFWYMFVVFYELQVIFHLMGYWKILNLFGHPIFHQNEKGKSFSNFVLKLKIYSGDPNTGRTKSGIFWINCQNFKLNLIWIDWIIYSQCS